jgi:hypothetical protein
VSVGRRVLGGGVDFQRVHPALSSFLISGNVEIWTNNRQAAVYLDLIQSIGVHMSHHAVDPVEPGALSVPAFCQWAGISRAWAWQLIANGTLGSVKRGRRRLIPLKDARAWLAGAATSAEA